jgi:hypothetical protein
MLVLVLVLVTLGEQRRWARTGQQRERREGKRSPQRNDLGAPNPIQSQDRTMSRASVLIRMSDM